MILWKGYDIISNMNITYLYKDLSVPFDEYKSLLPFVSEERRDRIMNCPRESGRTEILLSGLLLRRELIRAGIPSDKHSFSYGENGKPYLADGGAHFSLSHSGGVIACACGDVPVGLDVQIIDQRDRMAAMRFFTDNERAYIEQSDDKTVAFYRIWTAKEAYVKLIGRGLSEPLRGFDVLDESTGCMYQTQTLRDFVITVCVSGKDMIIPSLQQITEKQLLAEIKQEAIK